MYILITRKYSFSLHYGSDTLRAQPEFIPLRQAYMSLLLTKNVNVRNFVECTSIYCTAILKFILNISNHIRLPNFIHCCECMRFFNQRFRVNCYYCLLRIRHCQRTCTSTVFFQLLYSLVLEECQLTWAKFWRKSHDSSFQENQKPFYTQNHTFRNIY
jgi:hypothetical protein